MQRRKEDTIERLLQILRSKGVAAIHSLERDEQRLIWSWTQNVVNAYDEVLQGDARSMRNAAELPYSKEKIKLALKIALMFHVTKGEQAQVKSLRNRFLDLASFQEVVESDREKMIDEESRGRTESTRPGNRNLFPFYSKYSNMVVTEKKRLLEEIDTFISDLPTSG